KGGIGGDEGGFCFGDESGVAGKIEEIDFYVGAFAEGAGPLGVSEAGLNGDFSGNFFLVPVAGGAAVRNFSPAWGGARGEEQRRHQLRLAGAAVADNANVANVLGEIVFHTVLRD